MLHREVITMIAILLIFTNRAYTNSPKEYQIPAFRTNWFQATEFCNSIGMQLATIRSREENDAVAKYVQSTDKFNDEASKFWIGGSDLAEEGTFTWTADARLVTYANWSPGEPNNDNGVEDCIQLVYIPGLEQRWTWNDNECKKRKLYFICESALRDCVKQF